MTVVYVMMIQQMIILHVLKIVPKYGAELQQLMIAEYVMMIHQMIILHVLRIVR